MVALKNIVPIVQYSLVMFDQFALISRRLIIYLIYRHVHLFSMTASWESVLTHQFISICAVFFSKLNSNWRCQYDQSKNRSLRKSTSKRLAYRQVTTSYYYKKQKQFFKYMNMIIQMVIFITVIQSHMYVEIFELKSSLNSLPAWKKRRQSHLLLIVEFFLKI